MLFKLIGLAINSVAIDFYLTCTHGLKNAARTPQTIFSNKIGFPLEGIHRRITLCLNVFCLLVK